MVEIITPSYSQAYNDGVEDQSETVRASPEYLIRRSRISHRPEPESDISSSGLPSVSARSGRSSFHRGSWMGRRIVHVYPLGNSGGI